jgi:hypothetical protein
MTRCEKRNLQARGVSRELAIAGAFARGACSTSPLCGRQEAGSTFQRLAAAVVAAAASGPRGGANHAGGARTAFELPVACSSYGLRSSRQWPDPSR